MQGRDALKAAAHRPRPAVGPVSLVRDHSAKNRRYQVWALQQAAGLEPCFGTARRLVCDQRDCPWRAECQGLRAEWMR